MNATSSFAYAHTGPQNAERPGLGDGRHRRARPPHRLPARCLRPRELLRPLLGERFRADLDRCGNGPPSPPTTPTTRFGLTDHHPDVDDCLAVALVVIGLVGTAFWVLVAVGPKWEWWMKHVERLDDRAQERRDQGYKVNPGVLFG
jgi:hypothetical protein